MTPQQLNAMKMALEALEGLKSLYGGKGHKLHEINMIHRNHDTAITALEKALAEHAMQEVQRLGQEIEQEPIGFVQQSVLDWLYSKHRSSNAHTITTIAKSPTETEDVAIYTAPPKETT